MSPRRAGAASGRDQPRTARLSPELRLVLARVRGRARLRAEWLRKLWSEDGEPGGTRAVTHAEVDAALEDRDSPEAEAAWIRSQDRLRKLRDHVAAVEERLRAGGEGRLAQFEGIFGLEPEDSDLFQTCLALALDPGLGRVFAYLQDLAGRAYLTEELAARLLGDGRSRSWSAESALFRWDLIAEQEVAPGEPRALTCDPQVRNWFLGRKELDRSLVGAARLRPHLEPLPRWPVQRALEFFERVVHGEPAGRARLTLSGPPGSGRRTLASVVASRLGLPLLTIDCDAIEDQDWRRAFLRAQRQAYLERWGLAWHGESVTRRTWPHVVLPFPIQFAVVEPGQAAPRLEGVAELRLEMPVLDVEERRGLWRQSLPVAESWPPGRLDALARRYRATPGDIAAVARTGVRTPGEAARRVRETARGRLGDLAQLLECPFGWEDLVVSDHVRETLEDLVYEASRRTAFWEEPRHRKLFPQGRGLLALFSGSPGTGKTMAAQVIAARLGFDLYRIDLSAIVSKYVGETSQNLEKLLRRAATMDVVLLFDEAESFYTRRTSEVRDAQDKFANMDTSHLMVAIESYSGVVLLATNLKSNIDPAFLRRLRYSVEFPKPDPAQRLEIWRKVVGGLAGPERLAALESELERLAADVEATGAQIKYAVLAAVFIAARRRASLALPHLLRGLDRELAKEGRSLSEREHVRLLKHAS